MTVGTGSDDWDVTTGDTTPTAFSFTDQTDVQLSTSTESNILQITGLNISTPVSISGDGTPQYRICSDATCSSVAHTWSSAAGTIDNNEYLQLKLTSSSLLSVTNSATITVGTGSDNWGVTTIPPVGQQAYTTPGTYDWTAPEEVTSVSVVCVGGGGGGHMYGNYSGGGGGGGLGYKNNISVTPGESYTVVVGTGGSRATSYSTSTTATDGGDSYFINTSTVKGGGGEAGKYNPSTDISSGGDYVGDGGGNGGDARYPSSYAGGGAGAGGYSGDGGDSGYDNYGNGVSGSGGGGGGGGNCGSGDAAGNGGGVGLYGEGSSGAGGSGSSSNAYNGYGGSGGEGGGLGGGLAQGSSAYENEGGLYGGGGGGADTSNGEHGDGGGGACRIIWGSGREFPSTDTEDQASLSKEMEPAGSVTATGGTITTSGGYTIHTFTSSGTFTVSEASVGAEVETLIVAGGGSGGNHSTSNGNGGGGGGGVIYTTTGVLAQGYSVTVGAGGTAIANTTSSQGNNGGNSTFNSLTAIGGGGGGSTGAGPGKNGGSGGGAAYNQTGAGSSTQTGGYGNDGGSPGIPYTGGGGGGAGGPGISGSSSYPGGNGGTGYISAISGTVKYYAGGGGGGGNSSQRAGDGYHGGGRGFGTTSYYNYNSYPDEINSTTLGSGTPDAVPNTGGGGGAGSYWASNGGWTEGSGDGGSGIVIIRYLTDGAADLAENYPTPSEENIQEALGEETYSQLTEEEKQTLLPQPGDIVSVTGDLQGDLLKTLNSIQEESAQQTEGFSENYPTENTVVGVPSYAVVKTNQEYDNKILGIVSTNPAITIGPEDQTTVPIALVGRVPVKIDPNSEPIEIGDYLTSSNQPGQAKKATQGGQIVAKALDTWTPENNQEDILAFVSLQWVSSEYYLNNDTTRDSLVSNILNSLKLKLDEILPETEESQTGMFNRFVLLMETSFQELGLRIENNIASIAGININNHTIYHQPDQTGIGFNTNNPSALLDLQVPANNQTDIFNISQENSGDILNITQEGNINMGNTLTPTQLSLAGKLNLQNIDSPTTIPEGSTLYSHLGELYTIDQQGNITQLSPHNEEGLWYYQSTNLNTNTTLTVEMEKLTKELDKLLGGGFVFENGELYTQNNDQIQTISNYPEEIERINEEILNLNDWILNQVQNDNQIEDLNQELSELTLTVEGLNETDTMIIEKLTDHEARIVELETSLAGSRIESGMTEGEAGITNPEITNSLEDLGELLVSNQDEEGNTIFTLNGDLELVNLKAQKGEFEEIESQKANFEDVTVAGINVGENSSGKAVILAGETEVVIESELVKEVTTIHLTLTSKKNGQDIYIKEIIEGQGFTVEIEEGEALSDLHFNWLILN
jgi:hypothetical protein